MFLDIYTDLGTAGASAGTNIVSSTSTGLTSLLTTDIGLVIVIPLVFAVLYWAYRKIGSAFGSSQA